MHIVPLSSILVGDRQRSEIRPADQESLMESILKNGLLHAVVVETLPATGDREPTRYDLLAGERRFRAITALAEFGSPIHYNNEMIPLGSIPVTLRAELSDEARQEIELEENIRRVDLSWADRCRAIARLHDLRKAANPEQTIVATQSELSSMGNHMNQLDVSRSITVAKHLSNPKVAAARSMKEALNIVTKNIEAELRADLLKATTQESEHEILCGDCISIMQQMPDAHVDCIITDPPYGMGADDFGKHGPAHQYADDPIAAFAIAKEILQEGFRVCKADAHLYMFCDIESFTRLKETAQHYGWRAFRTPLTWHKTSAMGHDPWPQTGFRRSTEWILYAVKGNRPYQVAMNDLIAVPNISSSLHPATKPVELYRRLLERSCLPGDVVLDPCCGLGPIFEAASALHLRAIGIEADPDYAKVASNRRFEKLEPEA